MELGKYIEHILKEKKLTKQWLYNEFVKYFYSTTNKKKLTANSFSVKLSNNSLKADELIYIAYILDIDLNKLKRYVYKNIKSNLISLDSNIPTYVKEIIFKYSTFNIYTSNLSHDLLSSNCIYQINQLDNNVYNFIIFSQKYNIAISELFNFNNNSYLTLCNINNLNHFLLEKSISFEVLHSYSSKTLSDLLLHEAQEYSLLFPDEYSREKIFEV